MNSWFLMFLSLLLVGALGAYTMIVAKRPDAQKILDSITPFKGIIGVIVAIYGIYNVIDSLLNIELLSTSFFGSSIKIFWVTWLVSGLVQLSLGFVLGYDMIAKVLFANKGGEAEIKAQNMRVKLAARSSQLGMFALILAVWWIILRFIILKF